MLSNVCLSEMLEVVCFVKCIDSEAFVDTFKLKLVF